MSRHTYEVLPPRVVKADGFEYEHQVRIALPPSYSESSSTTYPVLWLTDSSVLFDLVVGSLSGMTLTQEVRELIVVGVGSPADADSGEFNRRRTFELLSEPDWYVPGPSGDQMAAALAQSWQPGEEWVGGGADAFLTFLVDELRPQLQREFRMDDDHGLVGHSAGGYFAAYALLTRPGAFQRFIAGSPGLSGCRDRLFSLEEEYAASHNDLTGSVYIAFGGAEMTDPWIAMTDIPASATRMAQNLTIRSYPSLQLTVQVFPEQNHMSVAPFVVADGIRTLYAKTG